MIYIYFLFLQYNNMFYIIPFLAIHDNLENEELINKLVNETDKLSCKAVLLND